MHDAHANYSGLFAIYRGLFAILGEVCMHLRYEIHSAGHEDMKYVPPCTDGTKKVNVTLHSVACPLLVTYNVVLQCVVG